MIRTAAVLATSLLVALQAVGPAAICPLSRRAAARRRSRQGPARADDARREVLAALHDPGQPRRSVARLLQGRLRAADFDRTRWRQAGGTAGEVAQAHAERINAIQRFFVEKTRLGIPIIPFEEAAPRPRARGRDDVPAGDRAGGDVGHGAHARASRTPPRAKPAAAASARSSRRSSTSRTTCAGDGWRRRTARTRTCRRRWGARSSSAFETRRHRHDAEALRRERRRRRPRQLSRPAQRAAAAGAVLSAVRGGGARGARAVGDDGLQLGGRPAGDAEPAAAERHPQGRLGVRRVRDFGRGGDRRRDRAAHDGAQHAGGREARVGVRPRRGLPVFVSVNFGRTGTPCSAGCFACGRSTPRSRACCASSSSSASSSSRTSTQPELRRLPATPDHRALAREAARASIVLLKNDGVLPLSAAISPSP